MIQFFKIQKSGYQKFNDSRIQRLCAQKIMGFLIFIFSLLPVPYAHAAHPLITDDTGTQGKRRFQVEINSEFIYDKEISDGVTTKKTGGEIATILSYGVIDNMDIIFGLPYQWIKTEEDGDPSSDVDGIADMSLEVKWRFYEHKGLGLALKPGITFPTGDRDKGLGTGRATYGLFFITTKEIEPLAFHINIGYTRNENRIDERKDIWHASLAGELEVLRNLKVVANIGVETDPDRESNTHPAFILGGLIYSISEDIAFDFGVKGALNKPETDLTFLAGIAVKF